MMHIKVSNYMVLIIVLVLSIVVYNYYNQKLSVLSGPNTIKRSEIDFNLYQVRDSEDHLSDKKAADRLAIINKEIDRLVTYMRKHNLPDKETAERLYNRWLDCELKETLNDLHIAFTINKGASIYLCLRDEEQNLQDYNVGIYIILHELAHIMSKSRDHTEEFENNFKELIKIATKINMYKPINFSEEPKTYCGETISN